jgi:hypothetical protein
MSRSAGFVFLLVFAATAHAHHSQAGIFNSRETIEVTGVIKSVSWRNPHGQILLDVTDERGNVVEWDAETASISILRNRGVEGSSIQVGERVTIAGSPSMRNRPEILATSVLLPTGYEFTFGSAQAHFAEGKAGRIVGRAVIDADVDEAIAKADGIYRVWSTIMSDPDAFPMFKGGYPLTEAGKAGAAAWNPRDNALLKCGTKGQPLIMITPIPIEFVREGDDIVMRIEEYDSIGFLTRALRGHDTRRRDRSHRGGLFRSRRCAAERADPHRRALHAERGQRPNGLHADDDGSGQFLRAVYTQALLRMEA